jgi:hypothetical protein
MGVGQTVGGAAGIALSAPIAILDPNFGGRSIVPLNARQTWPRRERPLSPEATEPQRATAEAGHSFAPLGAECVARAEGGLPRFYNISFGYARQAVPPKPQAGS